MKSRADFTYTIEDGILCIIDLDNGNMSVTNDIENVIADIEASEGQIEGTRILYRDSWGVWDRYIKTGPNGKFECIGVKNKAAAIDILKQRNRLEGGEGE